MKNVSWIPYENFAPIYPYLSGTGRRFFEDVTVRARKQRFFKVPFSARKGLPNKFMQK